MELSGAQQEHKILQWEDLGTVKRWVTARKFLYSVSAWADLQIEWKRHDHFLLCFLTPVLLHLIHLPCLSSSLDQGLFEDRDFVYYSSKTSVHYVVYGTCSVNTTYLVYLLSQQSYEDFVLFILQIKLRPSRD